MNQALEALAVARWQAFRNSLRVKRKKYELAARIAMSVFGALVAALVGLTVGSMTYFGLERGRPVMVAVVLWIIFNMWQLGPVMVEGSSPAVNFREIARYPVTFRLYYWLNTLYGLLDPAALVSIVWLACVWAAILLARPRWVDRALLLLLAFIIVNVFLNRVLFSFLERVMSTRRGRERLMLVFLLFGVASQFTIYLALPGAKKESSQTFRRVLVAANRISPPGIVAGALPGGRGAAVPLLELCAWAGAAALILRRQMWRNYRGETQSDTPPPAGAVRVQPGWRFPALGDAHSAILEKEIRYAARDPRTLLAAVSAPLMAMIILLSSQVSQKVLREAFSGRPEDMYPGLMAYALLAVGTLSFNSFCYEARGFQLWQMAPVNLRAVLMAKNAVLAALIGANFVVLTPLLNASMGLSARLVLLVALGTVYATLAIFGAGNYISVRYPMRVEYGTLSTRNTSSVAVLVSLAFQIEILGSVWLVLTLERALEIGWVAPAALAGLSVLAAWFYRQTLEDAVAYAGARGDEIAGAVG